MRICPERDGPCPHGDGCPYSIDRYNCKQNSDDPTTTAWAIFDSRGIKLHSIRSNEFSAMRAHEKLNGIPWEKLRRDNLCYAAPIEINEVKK